MRDCFESTQRHRTPNAAQISALDCPRDFASVAIFHGGGYRADQIAMCAGLSAGAVPSLRFALAALALAPEAHQHLMETSASGKIVLIP